ncbi:MAG: hypothetical protein JSW73_05005 [Candidatus Woesearchaeota archaeon]|nr:MAG: hypothetical protein JSW73_05005 [Candidatus Woesearchaeota archaeon]
MIDFDEGLKPSSDNLATQVKRKKDFIDIFKDKEKYADLIIPSLKKTYKHPTFSDEYKENQINRLENIFESLENTYLIGSSAITEAKKIGELGFNWDSLENIVKDYGCATLYVSLKEHFNAFYKFWANKVNLDDKVEINYSFTLEEHQKSANNFKDFNPTLMGEKVSEFVDSIISYASELNKNVELLELFNNMAKDIETKIEHTEFRENLEKLKVSLKNNLDKLLNARVLYSQTISEDFEGEFSDFLETTSRVIPTNEEIVNIVKEPGKKGDETNVLKEVLYSLKSQEEEFQKLSTGLDLMNKGDYLKARKEFEEVIKLNDKSSKAHFYMGLNHLIDVEQLNVNKKGIYKWYDGTLKKAVNELEKAREYSIAETPLYQSKTYALLALSKLLCGENAKKSLELVNTSIELSDNSLSRFVKSEVLSSMYQDSKSFRYLEDIIGNLDKVKEEDLKDIKLRNLLSLEDLYSKKAQTLLLKRTKEDIPQIKELLGKALDENRDHIISHITMSDVLLWEGTEYKKKEDAILNNIESAIYIRRVKSPYKKEALKHLKTALELSQNELEKNSENPKMVRFLLRHKNYKLPYDKYIDFMSERKGEKIKHILDEMIKKGTFRKIKI